MPNRAFGRRSGGPWNLPLLPAPSVKPWCGKSAEPSKRSYSSRFASAAFAEKSTYRALRTKRIAGRRAEKQHGKRKTSAVIKPVALYVRVSTRDKGQEPETQL